MFRLILFIVFTTFVSATASGKVAYPASKIFVYRYYLRNKIGGGYSIEHPQHFLSKKSIERRKRQGLKIDSTDLPIPNQYLQRFHVRNTKVVGTSRWNNTVLVSSADSSILNQLALMPIVREARMVFQAPDSVNETPPTERVKYHQHFNHWDSVHNDPFGMARPQIEMLQGIRLHELELRGKGMTIAVLDGGFQNADRLPFLANTHIVGTHDFVSPVVGSLSTDIYHDIDHGTKVLSLMAANVPEVIMGTAPEASYWLLRCEDHYTEMPIEEDYWAMAAEFADSVGADILNSSLGYCEYDNGMGSYALNDLDGQTALISRTASMLARKGMILCNSAGNSGTGSWKKITVPADAFDIIAVGAVNAERKNAPFSSVGPTQDGRIKPDVTALGNGSTLITGRGTLVRDMGTSFSTPIVCGMIACLWQGLPKMTAKQIMNLVRQSASLYDTPNNIYGYGIPDFWLAYMHGQLLSHPK